MKKIITSIALCFAGLTSIAQIGAVAPNFIDTDINGVDHDLYDHLASGRVVIVDMFATWCGPCWNFHTAHFLEDLNTEFGPNGTDQVVIIGYEDAQNTSLADLYGTGTNTLGDWVTGISYPMISGASMLPGQYGTGYPTISVICPTDNKIKYHLQQSGSLQQMRTDVLDVINQCSTASINETSTLIDLSISPNPTSNITSINFNALTAESSVINVYRVSGDLVSTRSHQVVVGANTIKLDLSSLEVGTYFLKVETSGAVSQMTTLVKM